MRYGDDDRQSSNVEDRRGQRGGGFRFPGGFNFPGRGQRGQRGRQIRIPMGGGRRGGFSLTTLIIIGVVMFFLGFNPLDLLRGATSGGGSAPDMSQIPRLPRTEGGRQVSTNDPFRIPGGRQQGQSRAQPGGQPGAQSTGGDDLAVFTKQVLADTEDVWRRVFQQIGKRYKEPTLVLYRGSTRSACGQGQAAMGPFYCPGDQRIYIDLSFYSELRRRFQAPGDFAQAYVIAHEVGHHIQYQFGIATRVQQMKRRVSRVDGNRIQVRMELQADCFAGVWANLNDRLKQRLEPGDIQEGLRAAAAIGDDMMQRRATGRVVPDAFTHGSSEQRVRWFRRGFDSGKIQDCDTFSASRI